jgi:hypothetical protein
MAASAFLNNRANLWIYPGRVVAMWVLQPRLVELMPSYRRAV